MPKSQIIKKSVFAFFTSIVLLLIIMAILRYDVEGEKNMPYNLSKILVVSTIDGKQNDDDKNLWNIDVNQANDLYFYITPNGITNKTIKQIKIKNFNIISTPNKGDVIIYRPTGELNNLYTYSELNYLGSELVYSGGRIDDLKTLEIANTGGVLGFRVSIENLGKFTSEDKIEVIYDGSLLNSVGVEYDDLTLELNFDILLQTNDNITYKGNLTIELPEKSVFETGKGITEITDFSRVIFKRINE